MEIPDKVLLFIDQAINERNEQDKYDKGFKAGLQYAKHLILHDEKAHFSGEHCCGECDYFYVNSLMECACGRDWLSTSYWAHPCEFFKLNKKEEK